MYVQHCIRDTVFHPTQARLLKWALDIMKKNWTQSLCNNFRIKHRYK